MNAHGRAARAPRIFALLGTLRGYLAMAVTGAHHGNDRGAQLLGDGLHGLRSRFAMESSDEGKGSDHAQKAPEHAL